MTKNRKKRRITPTKKICNMEKDKTHGGEGGKAADLAVSSLELGTSFLSVNKVKVNHVYI